MNTYSNNDIHSMNYDYKCGTNWIKKDSTLPNSNNYKLYPTGDATISSGRIYIALPSNTIIDEKIKQKYNII